MDNNLIYEKYNKLFPNTMTFEEVSKKLDLLEADTDIAELRRIYCNNLVYIVTQGYIEFTKDLDIASTDLGKLLIHHIKKLPKTDTFYWMMYSFFTKDYISCLTYFDEDVDRIKTQLKEKDGRLIEADLMDSYIEPLKDAFPGFWKHAQEKLSPLCEHDGTHELCSLMDAIYSRENDEEGVDELTKFIQKHPKIVCAKEYLGCLYANLKKWNNAIACFESLDSPMLFANCPDSMYFTIGLAYGSLKDYKNEEKSYRKCLEIYPFALYARNNLAYCLYKQKKYSEAKDILEKCISDDADMPYAANNYVRVLIALGRNTDAKEFIKNSKHKIVKALVDRVNKLDNANKKIAKAEAAEDLDDVEEVIADTSLLKAKGSQFTTEKILEDELTARIENGIPVFGKKLKVYKRKGAYGRQFIIPIGRLDLLCEDDDGNLYIIELKKDSGYDDAYVQTSQYLDWFSKNWKEHKNIYGIICLNNPTQKLLDKVHSDKRMKVYEYQVSYTER